MAIKQPNGVIRTNKEAAVDSNSAKLCVNKIDMTNVTFGKAANGEKAVMNDHISAICPNSGVACAAKGRLTTVIITALNDNSATVGYYCISIITHNGDIFIENHLALVYNHRFLRSPNSNISCVLLHNSGKLHLIADKSICIHPTNKTAIALSRCSCG